jgi:hypothetical protein
MQWGIAKEMQDKGGSQVLIFGFKFDCRRDEIGVASKFMVLRVMLKEVDIWSLICYGGST